MSQQRVRQLQRQAATPTVAPPAQKPFSWQRPFPVPASDTATTAPQPIPDLQARLEILRRANPDWSKVKFSSTPAKAVQAKLTVGAPNDQYEQEADRVADQVMSMPDGATKQPVQREAAPKEDELQTKPLAASITPLVQRDMAPEEEEVQPKLAADALQREAMPEEDEIQPKLLGSIQRAEMTEEEEVQTKPLGHSIQREEMPEEEELQTKPLSNGTLQREAMPEEEEEPVQAKLSGSADIQREAMPEEEEEVQTKPLASPSIQREALPEEDEPLQTKPSPTPDSPHPAPSLESQLSSTQGSGSPLPHDVRSFMEPRFGADFSQVRVHTDSEAVQMNRDLNAQAFTHKQDVYFGAGKTPGKDALTAHELTHVVQQSDLKGERVGQNNEEYGLFSIVEGGWQTNQINRADTPTTSPPAAPVPNRIIQIDNNVIVEIGKGNAVVAQTLRALCQTPNVKVQMDRGNYIEATRVGPNVSAAEVAARKVLIEKLSIEIIDVPMAQRVPVYEDFAKDSNNHFTKHGAPVVSNKARKTFDDLPHVATAISNKAEVWSYDNQVRENTKKLTGKQESVAPESYLPTVQDVSSSEKNIMHLIPEVKSSEVANRLIKPTKSQPNITNTVTPINTAKPISPKTSVFKSAIRTVAGGIAALGLGILFSWLQEKLDQGQIERDMRRIEPQAQERLNTLAAKVAELQCQKSPQLYANITVKMTYHHFREPAELPSPPVEFSRYAGTELISVDVSNSKIENKKSSSQWDATHTLEIIDTSITYSAPLEPLSKEEIRQYLLTQISEEENAVNSTSSTTEQLERSQRRRDSLNEKLRRLENQ